VSPETAIVHVEEATRADLDRGIEEALRELRLTREELKDQADRDDFESESARLTWFIISGLAA
jgi:hypothetical protein